MKRIYFFCFFLLAIPLSFATPPTSITLTYDLAKSSLHVEADHPSFNLDKSYVRLMNIYVNGAQIFARNYYRQEAYDKFSDDLPLTAQVGDVIKVDLFCSLGGEMSKELKVKKLESS